MTTGHTAPAKRQLVCNNNDGPGSGDTLDNAGEYVPDTGIAFGWTKSADVWRPNDHHGTVL
jgi:hypothetical protein